MKVEVLLSTMNQSNIDIYEQMNIETDAIIINQSNFNGYNKKNINNKKIEMYSFDEKGVGKSRNAALSRSTSEICLIADDDMIFFNDYEKTIIQAFHDNPKADVIIFNLVAENINGNLSCKVKNSGKVHFYNYLRYGTANIAFKRKKIVKENIFFSLLFGGGAKYGSGEDTLFLTECLKKGLNVYTHETLIAKIKYRPSTWFEGYNEKYFYDKGALFTAINKKTVYIKILLFIFKHKKMFKEYNYFQMFLWMLRGVNDFKRLE
ncbi:glycosyltransferase family A protein [Exiguobacterium sp. s80]|uniref:glycosyltransferase family 2 protein n=1 Tax=Exiguobacterium sp. s80 TaxID=2751209 RepID=UPI001BEC68BB|nr:glycosyltransferase family A protein [Exiguobacterium sp. s80]